MAEHGIFPPASLQSNDPPKVFSLTLTTAYKRDQFLPLGQRRDGILYYWVKVGTESTKDDQRSNLELRKPKWSCATPENGKQFYKITAVLPRGSSTDIVGFMQRTACSLFFLFFFYRHPKISTVKRWCLPVHSPCLSILCFSVMEHI